MIENTILVVLRRWRAIRLGRARTSAPVTKPPRAVITALALIAAAGIALAQGSPIPRNFIDCPPTLPPADIGTGSRSCYSFEGVAGEAIESTCSGYNLGPNGVIYGIGCELWLGPLDGSVFASASATNGNTAHLYYTIPQTGTFLSAVIFVGRTGWFGAENFSLDSLSPPRCIGDATSLCLWGSRFRVSADWEASDGTQTHATAVPLTTDSGYFWFFDASNVELVAKVLNGCGTNNHYWFFASGLTNVGVRLTVTDVLSGTIQHYSNPAGTPFVPIQDTIAFATCP